MGGERGVRTFEFLGSGQDQGGVYFRVWAPNADKVSVIGSFNGWNPDSNPMNRDAKGCWSTLVPQAKTGAEYRYHIVRGSQVFARIDPCARQVTSSVGNGVVQETAFEWGNADFRMPPWNELVVYELHIGTFGRSKEEKHPSNFEEAVWKFDHLRRLGVNAIQVMPAGEFAGDYSWGYNPAYIFAVETVYGGPTGLKWFVKQAHAAGLAVMMDVVYNHFGPSDLGLWQFDGWSENGQGGIYFYNDWKNDTPWGKTRPDYGRAEVREYIRSNAMMWLEEYHIDGLRWDSTLYVRTVHGRQGDKGDELPDGWSLMQDVNGEIRRRFPERLTVAEDLQNNEWLTRDAESGGAGFGAQWDAGFVHPIRQAVTTPDDRSRSMAAVRDALMHAYNADAFQRVVYSESHDEVANGRRRVPSDISPEDPDNWFAQKRSTLAAALVMTAPGIPMLFEGQEFLQGLWFRDNVPLDWDQSETFAGIVLLYRDLIRLRLNRSGTTRGLCGKGANVHHVDEGNKVIAMHRWDKGGPKDDVVIVANFANKAQENYDIGLPREGKWQVRFNSDWNGYSKDFGNFQSGEVASQSGGLDGCSCKGRVGIGPYSVLLLSQDE